MKFTYGIWFDRENTSIYNAVEVGDVKYPQPGHVRALCTTRHVRERGDTLNKPTITVNLSSPAPNVVAGAVWHFRGAKTNEPRFQLYGGSVTPCSDIEPQTSTNATTLQSGGLSAVLNTQPKSFCIAFRESSTGRLLTDLGFASVQYIVGAPGRAVTLAQEAATCIADPYYRAPNSSSRVPFIALSFGLGVNEYVYGLGERFGPFVKNGQEIDLWNEDGGTCSPYTYKNVPFYMTNRGYGIFFDHSDVLSFEVQNEKLSKVQVSIQGEELRFYVIYGASPKEILARYADMTGHPPLPPAWSFGLYLSTSFLTDYDEKTVMSQLDGMAERNIPVSVLHFDCFWMKAHTWTSFRFDPKFFPDPKAFLDRLHQRGLRVCVWINAYIAQESEVFDEAMERSYLIKTLDGSVWQSDIWQAGMGIVDFTNPDAAKWYQGQLQYLLDLGVDSFKTDFGERIPWENVRFHNGMDPRAGHNYYSLIYNETVYNAIAEKRGQHQAALFARAATAGGQRFPVHWGGDCESTWAGMAQSLRGGLSLGMSGFGFWSHDIGGFMSEGQANTTPESAIYKRWLQWGLLSSHSRLHGSKTYRVPWLVDDEASAVLSKFSRLKNKLMPYIFAQAIDSHLNGLPLLRAMVIEFPEDPACYTLDTQYMLGDSLLVAPVFDEQGDVTYYVPAGRWVGLLDGQTRQGPSWFKERFDNFHLPLLLRENKVVLIGTEDRPDTNWGSALEHLVIGSVLTAEEEKAVLEAKVPSANIIGTYDSTIQITVRSTDGTVHADRPRMVGGGTGQAPDVLILSKEKHL
ncbi:glycoside hydrolase family 31 protein [Xylariaceae sp. FL1651]|nr:glycoside hydrolase family 31 protein [Xylariaceae sp. FL1651]